MASFDDLRAVGLRRLAELEKQAALHGPMTEPAILIEIQDLRHRYQGSSYRASWNRPRDLDYDFLMTTVSAALLRITAIENRNAAEDERRPRRHTIVNLWLGAISAGVVLILLLVVLGV